MSTKIFSINRGDSFEFSITIPEKYSIIKSYQLTSEDVVYFALLYPHQRFEDAILLRGYTAEDQDLETGELTIKLTSKDTCCLMPGIYYYTVKLQRGGSLTIAGDLDDAEEVRTIIERTKFIINE